jgi:hypothetical protein
MSFSYDAEAERTRFDLRRFEIKWYERTQAWILSRQIASRFCWGSLPT